ncbi:putative autotransported protein [Salmonella enterica subsp. enterica]|uniref:Putative autotransported protein n=1 Tax=Salmonella enterica I TaxID=59201 RepID=A0A379W210_SALET|nr:putative autotransported protein [Salmonella enterica subsp. enterica]
MDGASYITSATAGTGVISVQMSDATWNMTSSSTLTDLTLDSGATINFSHEDGEPWQTLTINEDYVGNGVSWSLILCSTMMIPKRTGCRFSAILQATHLLQ